jgi:hypothetical protein
MTRRVAMVLLQAAARILPPTRSEWARDMRAELDHVESDGAALSWAIGCVWASLWERANAMLNSNGQISKWVLALEWLVCFAPLTLLWGVAVSFIVSRENIPLETIVQTSVATLAPIALIVSMAATFAGSSARFTRFARPLAIGFALVSILQLVNAATDGRLNLQWFEINSSLFVLFGLLPLFGCLHLVHLSRAPSATA